MTNRERAMNILHYKAADRMPAVHFGYWNELLDEWAEQGHITKEEAKEWNDGNEADVLIDKKIGWDFNWYNTINIRYRLFPDFGYQELETLKDGSVRFLDSWGIIQKKKPGIVSIPSEEDYTLKDREAFEKLYLPKMQYCAERFDKEYFKKRYAKKMEYDAPLGYMYGSCLGDIRNMLSVIGLSYMIYDDYDLLKEICDIYTGVEQKCAEAVFEEGYKFDFMHFWEDVCFKNGPLVSPEVFEELTAHNYKRATDFAHKNGIDIISLDCDGVTEKVQKTWIDNGVNVLFPIEIGVWGDQFGPARQKYGERQLGVGGMDKTAFRKDKEAVDVEIKRVTELTALGGFIPCPDHRLMPGSKFELVQYYADKIKEIPLYPGK